MLLGNGGSYYVMIQNIKYALVEGHPNANDTII